MSVTVNGKPYEPEDAETVERLLVRLGFQARYALVERNRVPVSREEYATTPVEDGDARRWMQALYRARCADRLSTAEAVRAASTSVLAELRRTRADTHPRHWASFVAMGDWR